MLKALLGRKDLMLIYWDIVLFWDEVRRGAYVREPFITAFAMITFCPIYCKFFKGNKRMACLFNAFLIFAFGIIRDVLYERALEDCHLSYSMRSPNIQYFGYSLVAFGSLLVASAYYRLGIIGTYLGDHFGILMNKKIDGFPFNVVSHPMYEGASMIFLGCGLVRRRISGIILSFWAYVVYMFMAKIFEEPFTNRIYQKLPKKD